ncbi:hypothetical protein FM102_10470 [Corynebacterium glutamicum]|nr:hypothetical protein FM102_10470 [Corynebacterium glutamicum]
MFNVGNPETSKRLNVSLSAGHFHVDKIDNKAQMMFFASQLCH